MKHLQRKGIIQCPNGVDPWIPIGTQPAVFMQIAMLMQLKVSEICLVGGPDIGMAGRRDLQLLSRVGVTLEVVTVDTPDQISGALPAAREFLGGARCVVVSADTVWLAKGVGHRMSVANRRLRGATLIGTPETPLMTFLDAQATRWSSWVADHGSAADQLRALLDFYNQTNSFDVFSSVQGDQIASIASYSGRAYLEALIQQDPSWVDVADIKRVYERQLKADQRLVAGSQGASSGLTKTDGYGADLITGKHFG